jgi:iron(II)-dependent oxidoreductase
MRRFLPNTVEQWLLAIAPLTLLVGWLAGFPTVGAAASATALCIIAIRNSKLDDLRSLVRWPRREPEPSPAPQPREGEVPAEPRPRVRRPPSASLVDQLIEQRRVALLLRPQVAASLSREQLEFAQAALDDAMAIVPEGVVAVYARAHEGADERLAKQAERIINVEGFYLDRYQVTNREYLEFVEDGGYEQMSLWDEAIIPAVLGFLDRTNQPGPRYWAHGIFPSGQGEHPVVGVSWYEASAFARWAGKRLPTDPEWIKSGAWPVITEDGKPAQRRFPWGDAMDRRKVNLWGSGFNGTVPVASLPAGASVGGIHQLVGNVWEWTSTPFGAWEPAGRRIETAAPLKSIRGGAFDTYFEQQAHCQFQSGENPLARKHNIGFRCALGFCDIVLNSDGTDTERLEAGTNAHHTNAHHEAQPELEEALA